MKCSNVLCGVALILAGACTLLAGPDPVTGHIDCTAFVLTALLGGGIIISELVNKFTH